MRRDEIQERNEHGRSVLARWDGRVMQPVLGEFLFMQRLAYERVHCTVIAMNSCRDLHAEVEDCRQAPPVYLHLSEQWRTLKDSSLRPPGSQVQLIVFIVLAILLDKWSAFPFLNLPNSRQHSPSLL
jgi:hypothetical protein